MKFLIPFETKSISIDRNINIEIGFQNQTSEKLAFREGIRCAFRGNCDFWPFLNLSISVINFVLESNNDQRSRWVRYGQPVLQALTQVLGDVAGSALSQ